MGEEVPQPSLRRGVPLGTHVDRRRATLRDLDLAGALLGHPDQSLHQWDCLPPGSPHSLAPPLRGLEAGVG